MSSPLITTEEAPPTHWSPSTWLHLWSLCMWPSQNSQGPSGESAPAAVPRSPHAPASLQIGPKEVTVLRPLDWNKPQTVFFFWCLCVWRGEWLGAIKRRYCNMTSDRPKFRSCFSCVASYIVPDVWAHPGTRVSGKRRRQPTHSLRYSNVRHMLIYSSSTKPLLGMI